MSDIYVGSSDSLLSLEIELGRTGEALVNNISAVRQKASQSAERLTTLGHQCHARISRLHSMIANADEDEDTSGYEAEIEELQAQLHAVQNCQSRLEDSERSFEAVARRFEDVAGDGTARARQFLKQQAANIEEYVAFRSIDGGQGGSFVPAGVTSNNAGAPTEPLATGYRKSPPDPRDWIWKDLYGPPPADLPERVLLESNIGPVYDQGETPQCVCYSLAALKHHDEYHRGRGWLHFQPGPIYSRCKARDGAPTQDGTTVRDAMKVANKEGIVADDGNRYYVQGYARLQDVDDIRHALSLGKAVMIGVQVNGKELSNLERNALVNAPDQTDGGHCMVVCGYDQPQGLLRIRNSWGRNWGDNGHCWLRESYLIRDPDFEAWTSVCEKVEENSQLSSAPETPPLPSREVYPDSNYAWFHPGDIRLSPEDGAQLKWNGIPRDEAERTLRTITAMRPFLDLARQKPGEVMVLRDRIAQLEATPGAKRFSEQDLESIALYFGNDAIRVDLDGEGNFDVVNGRHRLYQAQAMGLPSIPVSISNKARRALAKRIEGGL